MPPPERTWVTGLLCVATWWQSRSFHVGSSCRPIFAADCTVGLRLLSRSGDAGCVGFIHQSAFGSDHIRDRSFHFWERDGRRQALYSAHDSTGVATKESQHHQLDLQRQEEYMIGLDGQHAIEGGPGDAGAAASGVTRLLDRAPLVVMMSLCFAVAVICALDRVAMSVAILPMSQQYGYSDTTKGLISSAFSWGYMVAMIPASVLASFVSPKWVMGVGVLLWSAGQVASPAAAATSMPALLTCRFAMGMSEAVTIPTIQAIVAEWVPVGQRSRWLALIISGLQLGVILAYLASPSVIEALDWPGIFLLYGGLGVVWLALWIPFAKDKPPPSVVAKVEAENQRELTADAAAAAARAGEAGAQNLAVVDAPPAAGDVAAEEAEDAKAANEGEAESGLAATWTMLNKVPWGLFLKDDRIWAIAGAHMAHNWGVYVLLAWLPTYFSQEFSLSLSDSSGASVAPWVAGAVAGNAAGWACDYLVNNEIMSATNARKLFQVVASVGPGICMYGLSQGPATPEAAENLFAGAIALGACSSAGFASSVQDLRSRYTSIIYGLTSAVSVVTGSIGTYLTGALLDNTHSWTNVWQVTAAVYMVGAVWYTGWYRAERIVGE